MIINPTKWDLRFLELAKNVSTWSKDPSTKVGAVIVKDRKILATGYNGFPRGIKDTPERYNDRPLKYQYVVHAEVNAVLNSVADVSGSVLYLYPGASPCCECAKVIIQSGIRRVIGTKFNFDTLPGWREGIDRALAMLEEAGVEVCEVEVNDDRYRSMEATTPA